METTLKKRTYEKKMVTVCASEEWTCDICSRDLDEDDEGAPPYNDRLDLASVTYNSYDKFVYGSDRGPIKNNGEDPVHEQPVVNHEFDICGSCFRKHIVPLFLESSIPGSMK